MYVLVATELCSCFKLLSNPTHSAGVLLVALDDWFANYMTGFYLVCTGGMCYFLAVQERRAQVSAEQVYDQM